MRFTLIELSDDTPGADEAPDGTPLAASFSSGEAC